MAKHKKIVPEFMLDNPNDTFMFLMPLSLKPDNEDIGNSYFEVAVKKLTTKEYFTTHISPEIFFTRYKLHRAYKNAKLDNKANKYLKTEKLTYKIDTRLPKEQYNTTLGQCLDKSLIGQLLNYSHKYMKEAQKTSCCVIKIGEHMDLIIPHSVIAIYYYCRSTTLREATLRSDLENLYYGYDCNPNDASIIVPRYVSEDDAPFIHRFLCQSEAAENFGKIGEYIFSYSRQYKDKNPTKELKSIPIKAKFPVEDEFSITARVSDFYHNRRHYRYVHEILDDDSDIGFSKFTTFFQGKKIITDTDDVDNLPTVPTKEPSETSERLKSSHANKSYKQNRVTSSRKNKCSSLVNIDMSTDKITDEEVLEKLKIMEEKASNEEVDQSLTDATGNGEKKIRKTNISTKGEEFKKKASIEYIHNFEVFQEYMDYMATQDVIQNLVVYKNNKIDLVYKDDGTINKKSAILGRERQYITATFKYKNSYVGLLELENDASASVSTWVISSKESVTESVFQKFIKLYVNDNMHINDIKKEYDKSTDIKFKTKNHEKNGKSVIWVAGILGKI